MAIRGAIHGHAPTIKFMEFDVHWKLVRRQVYHIEGLNYAHDFAMTRDYFIVHMTPFVDVSSDLAIKIAAGWVSAGDSMRLVPSLPSRILLLPRCQGDGEGGGDVIQCDTPSPMHIFHFGSAYQETVSSTGEVVVKFTAVTLGPKFNMKFDKKGISTSSLYMQFLLNVVILHILTPHILSCCLYSVVIERV
jgi:all-trans-8'-apo-beta-carotenal 15,15'-oxygenase